MSAIALVAAGFIVLTWLYDRAADTLSLLVNNWKFRHEGRGIARHATSTPDSGSRADSAGNLDTVGARNGGDRQHDTNLTNISYLTEAERDNVRRLSALIEFHTLPDGLVPPKSRGIRTQKVH